jgi:hypothetical protein
MSKSKARPAAPKRKPRWNKFRLRTLLVVLVAIGLALAYCQWHLHGPRLNYRTLPEVLASAKCDGFDLVQEPDRPGPYIDMDPASAENGQPLSGSLWANGKNRKYSVPGVPGAEFRVVGLIPQDGGEPTYIVLKRRTSPASASGEKK